MTDIKNVSEPRRIVILGSTGSIGTQTLEIISEASDKFEITGLSANKNWKLLARQVNTFKPDAVVLVDESYKAKFEAALTYKPGKIYYGSDSLPELAVHRNADLIVNSLVGFAGFSSTYEALKEGKYVALANKESLVVGGELLSKVPGFKERLIPVDSEHSAMLQCLVGENTDSVKKIVITASGGPFREWSHEQMKSITVEDALNHPNWEMGSKITIDSSTMMNKGLEIIEAHWLFDIDIENIEPVVHPQSIIHSIIEFKDGSSKAQMGPPDMKVPILYALTYPKRVAFDNKVLDYDKPFSLTFEPVDYKRFPCVKLAIESLKTGGIAPAVLNAANEVAVDRFLKNEIRYIQISEVIETCLNYFDYSSVTSSQDLLNADSETRKYVQTLLR